jgi:hypothetical protein
MPHPPARRLLGLVSTTALILGACGSEGGGAAAEADVRVAPFSDARVADAFTRIDALPPSRDAAPPTRPPPDAESPPDADPRPVDAESLEPDAASPADAAPPLPDAEPSAPPTTRIETQVVAAGGRLRGARFTLDATLAPLPQGRGALNSARYTLESGVLLREVER